jgi:hypothetical protein
LPLHKNSAHGVADDACGSDNADIETHCRVLPGYLAHQLLSGIRGWKMARECTDPCFTKRSRPPVNSARLDPIIMIMLAMHHRP